MFDLASVGKMLLFLGMIVAFFGLVLVLASRVPWLGRLPGDIVVQREGFSCFFPVVTMIVLSVVLTLVLNVIIRLLNR